MSDRARSLLAACEIINGWSSGSGDERDSDAADAARHIEERLADWQPSLPEDSDRLIAHSFYDDAVRSIARAAMRIYVTRSAEIEAAKDASPASIGGRLP